MKYQEIQKIAKGMGIKAFGLGKADLIRRIQEREGNIPCYGTDRVGWCGEEGCLWRPDCLPPQGKGRK